MNDGTGLGWPGEPTSDPREFSTGLGWPGERVRPQGDQVSPQAEEGSADAPVDGVSRETAPLAISPQVRTAGDLSDATPTFVDETTPLAQAAESSVLARLGARTRVSMPRPEKTRIVVVANQKGGVGKTTSTVNIAAALAQLGQRVLVVDLDPQGHASTALGAEHRRGVPSSYDALVDGTPLADIAVPTEDLPNLWVVPATIDLAGAEIELVSLVAREGRLAKALAAHPGIGTADAGGDERLDYVFIDCPPSLGLLTLNALVAGAEVLIPIQAEYYALEGLGQLLETIDMVKAHLNPGLQVSSILITMYDARTRLAAGVADEVREHFTDQVLKTTIPRSVRVSEAPSYGQTVMTYDPASPGALSYLEAAREFARKVSA